MSGDEEREEAERQRVLLFNIINAAIIMSTSSLSVNPALSPPSFSSSSSSSSSYTFFPSKVCCFSRTGRPIGQSCVKSESLLSRSFRRSEGLRFSQVRSSSELRLIAASSSSDVTGTEFGEDQGEESPPPLIESEKNSKPRRIAIFVEPSPFSLPC